MIALRQKSRDIWRSPLCTESSKTIFVQTKKLLKHGTKFRRRHPIACDSAQVAEVLRVETGNGGGLMIQMQDLTSTIRHMYNYHTKAPSDAYSLIATIDRELIERAANEIGSPNNWARNKRDEHPKLNEGRSLELREQTHKDTPFRYKYPSVEQIVNIVLRLGYGSMPGKILAAYLPPGAKIKPHKDGGEYYKYHNRIHIPLITAPEVTMFADDEPYHMDVGNVYLFQNLRRHSVVNNSETGRIHLIVDVLDTRYDAQFYQQYQSVLIVNPIWIGGLYRFRCYIRATRRGADVRTS